MRTSESITKIAPALVKAQAAIGKAAKSSENSHFHNAYADLESVLDAIHAAFAANGLALITLPGLTENGVAHFTTRLIHESAEWMEDDSSVPVAKLDPQGYASATTYVRRIQAAAWARLRLTDDDGNAASEPKQHAEPLSASQTWPAPKSGNGKGFPAKFDGKCCECGGVTAKGSMVMKHANGYGHVVCPQDEGMPELPPLPL